MTSFHPGLILIFGGILAGILPGRLRQLTMVLAPALALFSLFNLEINTIWSLPFINNLDLIVLKVDKLSWGFALIFCIMAILGNIYALHSKNRVEITAGLMYAGSSLGAVFAGDWVTLIFFWELMAVTSVFLIWCNGTAQSRAAGFRYILVHMFGGNLLLAGIFLKVSAGQTEIMSLTGTGDAAFWLILLGVAINSAIPPLHAWLADAYPEATLAGTVFMNCFTTKVAVYALIRIFPGAELLIWAGVFMALYGAMFAIIENDVRRLLSYHIVSQVGFMVAGVGMGTDLALNGAAAHAFSNIFNKSLLFMGAGAVIYATGLRKLTQLGGLWRKMPWVTIFFAIGALSIAGAPLFVGFNTKSLLLSAASYGGWPAVDLLLYLAGIGTFLSIALKLFWFMFFGEDRALEPVQIPTNMYVAMGGLGFLCIMYGVVPNALYNYLPYAMDYAPYTIDHVVSTIQLLAGALIVFWVFIPKMATKDVISLDTDWFYRRPMKVLIYGLVNIVCFIREFSAAKLLLALKSTLPFFANPVKWAAQTAEGTTKEYDEDRYRFPVGMNVLMSIIVFVLAFSYIIFV